MSVPWEFFSSSHFISQFPLTRFPLITAIRMCYLLPVHHLGMAFLAGSKRSKYNTTALHHHVVPLARISPTLSRYFSRSFIASGRSSGLHPVSLHCCCMYVLAGRPAFARPYVGLHWCTSLMSSSLLLQLCPACLVRLTWIVFEMGGRGRIVGALWGVAARTYSICLATFTTV